MRIATFNIRTSTGLDGLNSWLFRRSACADFVSTLNADVLMLQEVRPGQLRYLRARLPHYRLFAAGRNGRRGGGEHLVTAVRIDTRGNPGGPTVRWFGPDPTRPTRFDGARVNRIALAVEIHGRKFVNIHLDEAPNPNLGICVEHLLDWFGPRAIFAGDFNCRIDDEHLGPLWRAGYKDVLSALDARGPFSCTAHEFTGRSAGTRIDHVVVPSDVIVHSATIERVATRLPSDHWPVVAIVDIAPDGES